MGPLRALGQRLAGFAAGERVSSPPLARGVVPSHGTSSRTGRSARNASAIWSLWGILSAMAAVPTGIYARLAGDAGGQWDPESALGAVGAQHTARWRREHGLQNDADFAFAFPSFEGALATGGRDLANSWVRVRSAQESELLPAAAEVVEGEGRGGCSASPSRWTCIVIASGSS